MNSESEGWEHYKNAARTVDAATMAADDEEASRLWIEAANHAEKCLNIDPENPEYNYLRGYTLSRHPIKSEEYYERAVLLLERTLVINPAHVFAPYCLASLHFERKKYELALRSLEKVDCRRFLLIDQEWRCLIAAEMRFCSLLYLRSDLFPEKAAEDLRRSYLDFDPVLAPVPWNLLTCVDYLIKTNAPAVKEKKLLSILASIIERSNLNDFVRERFLAVYTCLAQRDGKP